MNSLLSDNKVFVCPPEGDRTFSTPYTRFKLIWLKAAKTAREEHRNYGITFSPDGQAVNVPDTTSTFHSIKFNHIGSTARSLVDDFTTAVQNSLPKDCASLYEEFSRLELTDDLNSPESIFKQPANQPSLQPMIQAITHQLLGTEDRLGSVFGKKSRTPDMGIIGKLLDEEQDILSLFNAAFQLSCGVPPQPFQLKSLRYDWDPESGEDRNLFMVWGALALANPSAKQLGVSVKECLWAFPSSLVTLVLFYLGVIRPAFCQLIGLIRGGAKEHSIYIFVHGIPKQRANARVLWNGSDVNSSLRRHTESFPVALTGTILRNITTGMLRKFFPSLTELDHLPDSLLDQQAQHR